MNNYLIKTDRISKRYPIKKQHVQTTTSLILLTYIFIT